MKRKSCIWKDSCLRDCVRTCPDYACEVPVSFPLFLDDLPTPHFSTEQIYNLLGIVGEHKSPDILDKIDEVMVVLQEAKEEILFHRLFHDACLECYDESR